MNELIEIKNFRPLSEFETSKKQLDIKGLYAIRVKNISMLPTLFKSELELNDTTLIYIGKAEKQTICKRLSQECEGSGPGTFFRGIGSLLNFKPEKGSQVGNVNPNNYGFSKENKVKIVDWMNANLVVNFIEIKNNIDFTQESRLIEKYCPILNTTHNPRKSITLANLRKTCREYALSK
ncbi:MAG: restriction endonuclease domain [Mucilaginibacter sp.]|nr:restriction endonuclease domain [Mucilaginibacter sp.]